MPDDIASKIDGGRDNKIKGLQEQIARDKEHIEYANAHIEKKTNTNKQSDTKDKQSDSKVNKKERLRIVYKEDKDPDGSIVGIFEDEHGEYQALTPTVSKTFKTISGAERFLANRGFENPNKADNSKEQEMALLEELKKLISRVENGKESDMEEKIENEKVDKRDIIRQIMAIAGKEEASENVKTIAKLAEKLAYDKSEAGTADNKKCKNEDEEKADNKKCKNEDEEDKEKVEELEEEVKEDADNKKVKNSKEESCFEKINAIYNSIKQVQNESKYTSRQDKLDAAKEYFS